MATKISEVVEKLQEIQRIHGDVAVYVAGGGEPEVRQGYYYSAIVAKIYTDRDEEEDF